MKIKLETTSQTYEYWHPNGYGFKVLTTKDPEWGWSAEMALESHGHTSPEGAVLSLKSVAEAFIKQLEEMEKNI